jgi:hypothetical protein
MARADDSNLMHEEHRPSPRQAARMKAHWSWREDCQKDSFRRRGGAAFVSADRQVQAEDLLLRYCNVNALRKAIHHFSRQLPGQRNRNK